VASRGTAHGTSYVRTVRRLPSGRWQARYPVQDGTLVAAPRTQTLTSLGFWVQTRLGEVLALRHADVDLDKGQLRIERQTVEVDGEGPRTTEPKVDSDAP